MGDKRLYKSSENSMLCGVCGGIAEYFDIDPTLVRLAWVILTCFGGAGIWAYIIAAIIIPKRKQPILQRKGVWAVLDKEKEIKAYLDGELLPEVRMKYEIAEEMGLLDRVLSDGWKSLSAKETGRIGGLMTKRKKKN